MRAAVAGVTATAPLAVALGSLREGQRAPQKLKGLRVMRSGREVDVDGVEGAWNAAHGIWLSVRRASDPTGGAELMVWIGRGGSAMPAGRRAAAVEIGGAGTLRLSAHVEGAERCGGRPC